MNATEAPKVNESELIETINTFIRSNRHSSCVENRWVCTVLEPLIPMLNQVRSGRLHGENLQAANAFRADELVEQIEAKRRDAQALERELVKVRAA